MTLGCAGLAVSGAGRDRLAPLDATFARGTLTAIIGPNGAGKSTLLRAILGLLPHRGAVTWDGDDVVACTPRERARTIAYLPQAGSVAWPLRVVDVVALGRHPHGDGPGSPSGRAAVDRAIAATDLAELANRTVDTLSGGEQARVLLARALAVEAPALLADEPGAALDVSHRLRVFGILRRRADMGGVVLVAVHDFGDVERWADRAIVLSEGRCVADGPPERVLEGSLLRDVFGVRLLDTGRFGPRWEVR